LAYTAFVPLTAGALAAIGRALGNYHRTQLLWPKVNPAAPTVADIVLAKRAGSKAQ